ncbi:MULTISPECIES: photosynthetic complex putative assembly protein PuhB [Rhodomicrobium]|uniref:photosynthetic complex putative assembly protein PuhB n=1 Tax=Rhodomicrobium TaxID=1068 RepID=UPI001482ED9F|nr:MULTISPECIES: photosynthetic complex putative assembly protein PuhB [Rhodomicrobium]
MSDFDFEPVPGLPQKLPDGEVLLWQGKPDWWVLARRVYHAGFVGAYLGLLIVWHVASALYDGRPLSETAGAVAWTSLLAAICTGILCGLAYATARTTIYTITSERLVLGIGIALPMAINIPYRIVEQAAARIYPGGYGDLPVTLRKGEVISYLVLWPHARPWRVSRPEPMLRGIPDAAVVSALLAHALATYASRPATREEIAPAANVKPLRPASDAGAEPRIARIA